MTINNKGNKLFSLKLFSTHTNYNKKKNGLFKKCNEKPVIIEADTEKKTD